MTRWAALIVVVWLAVLADARAERANPVEKLASDAAQAYHAGDYQRAAQLLERAYKMQPLPALLYNLAKAYEKLGDDDKAIDLYQRYTASDEADPKLKAKAEARLASLRESAAPRPRSAEPARPEPPPARDKAEPTAPPQTATRPSPPAAPPPMTPAPAPNEAERGLERDRGLAIGLGSVGVAALATAVGLSVNALALQNQFDQSLIEQQKRDLKSQAQTQALAADVLYGAGAACVGVAAYFLWRGLRPSPRNVAVAPLVSPSLAGLSAEGRF